MRTRRTFNKCILSPCYLDSTEIDSDIHLVFSRPEHTLINRPLAAGFVVLEESKLAMYRAYYGDVQKLQNPRLIFTDTDSLMIHTDNPNHREELTKIKDVLDLSNFKPDDAMYDDSRKKKIGYLKDEASGQRIVEFCGLAAKNYAYLVQEDGCLKEIKKGKGVKANALQKHITIRDYKDRLLSHSTKSIEFHNIQAKRHNLYVVKQNKVALNSFDDKRWILSCNIHTRAYGNKRNVQPNGNVCQICHPSRKRSFAALERQ